MRVCLLAGHTCQGLSSLIIYNKMQNTQDNDKDCGVKLRVYLNNRLSRVVASGTFPLPNNRAHFTNPRAWIPGNVWAAYDRLM